MSELPDQRTLWNEKHLAGEHAAFREEAGSQFAISSEIYFPKNATILDLGCGVGGDASYFVDRGHRVIATDFSEEVISQNQKLLTRPNLDFMVMDITEGLPFQARSFDGVYAHLSLHYYDHETTERIFKDIARVLKPGGLFGFACKTPKDPEYGEGIEIEPDLFISGKNHVRHFFTPRYAYKLADGLFSIESLDEASSHYSDKEAVFLRCLARKK